MERRKECEQYWIDFVPHTVNLLNTMTTPEAHRERAKANSKAWYESHKEEEKTRKKAYYESHKEKRKAYNKAYREARKNTPDTIHVSERPVINDSYQTLNG
jgi:thiamine pyrophosphate-dependent acetolactate synthase large subunit-like protein